MIDDSKYRAVSIPAPSQIDGDLICRLIPNCNLPCPEIGDKILVYINGWPMEAEIVRIFPERNFIYHARLKV